jgi:hypothetical protein
MKTASECRQYAAECRSLLSKGLSEEQRHQVLMMAEIWESLARDRERLHPDALQESRTHPRRSGRL